MAKESSLLKVFDGERLVSLYDGYSDATKRPLDIFEKEVLRIFKEYQQLQAENAGLNKDLDLHNVIVATYKAEFQQLRAENDKHRWIPVSERLPEDKVEVIGLFVRDGDISIRQVDYWYAQHKWRNENGDTIVIPPTHWKPIILPGQALKALKGE